MTITNELTFTVEERGPADKSGNKAKVVIDNHGYICGVFSTIEQVNAAIPRIKSNIEWGSIPKRCLKENPNRQNSRQPFRKR